MEDNRLPPSVDLEEKPITVDRRPHLPGSLENYSPITLSPSRLSFLYGPDYTFSSTDHDYFHGPTMVGTVNVPRNQTIEAL